jgi:hypothetical protein
MFLCFSTTLLTYPASSFRLIEASSPDEIYHMAAQAHVGRSFDLPHATALVTGIGAVNMLEAMRKRGIAPVQAALCSSATGLRPPTRAGGDRFGHWSAVKTFLDMAQAAQGIELEWEGSDERALCLETGKPS